MVRYKTEKQGCSQGSEISDSAEVEVKVNAGATRGEHFSKQMFPIAPARDEFIAASGQTKSDV